MAEFKRDKSGGALFENEGRGPEMRGEFELIPADLAELVELANDGKKAVFRLSLWPKKTGASGKDYYGLSIDKYKKETNAKTEKKGGFFNKDDGTVPDKQIEDEIPF